jgi:hypothetical protein
MQRICQANINQRPVPDALFMLQALGQHNIRRFPDAPVLKDETNYLVLVETNVYPGTATIGMLTFEITNGAWVRLMSSRTYTYHGPRFYLSHSNRGKLAGPDKIGRHDECR